MGWQSPGGGTLEQVEPAEVTDGGRWARVWRVAAAGQGPGGARSHTFLVCPRVLVCLRRRAFQKLDENGNCDGPCARYYYEGRVGACID